jgi:transcriptional regulator with XRE-family HTH domain
MTLGEKLKALRTRKGWSQRELAARSGVRQALISLLESGRQADTTGRNLRKLAMALAVTVDYLSGAYNDLDPEQPCPGAERRIEGLALPLVTTLPREETG